MNAIHDQIKFDDSDVVNPDEYVPAGEYNPNNVRPWLLHDHGFTLAVVFASSLQDALDEAADFGRLYRYAVAEADMGDYENEEGLSFLGNAGEAFGIDSLEVVELPNPKFSFVALFNAK